MVASRWRPHRAVGWIAQPLLAVSILGITIASVEQTIIVNSFENEDGWTYGQIFSVANTLSLGALLLSKIHTSRFISPDITEGLVKSFGQVQVILMFFCYTVLPFLQIIVVFGLVFVAILTSFISYDMIAVAFWQTTIGSLTMTLMGFALFSFATTFVVPVVFALIGSITLILSKWEIGHNTAANEGIETDSSNHQD